MAAVPMAAAMGALPFGLMASRRAGAEVPSSAPGSASASVSAQLVPFPVPNATSPSARLPDSAAMVLASAARAVSILDVEPTFSFMLFEASSTITAASFAGATVPGAGRAVSSAAADVAPRARTVKSRSPRTAKTFPRMLKSLPILKALQPLSIGFGCTRACNLTLNKAVFGRPISVCRGQRGIVGGTISRYAPRNWPTRLFACPIPLSNIS